MNATKIEFLNSDGEVGCVQITKDNGETTIYGDVSLIRGVGTRIHLEPITEPSPEEMTDEDRAFIKALNEQTANREAELANSR